MSRLALAMGVSCLVTISGPAAQEEARARTLRRAQLLAALKEKTAGSRRHPSSGRSSTPSNMSALLFSRPLASLGPGLDPARTCPLSQVDDNAMSEVAAEVGSLLHYPAPGRARQPGDA